MSNQNFAQSVQNFADLLVAEGRNELSDQGHILTGESSQSLHCKINFDKDGATITMMGEYYLLALHTGVTADRIPFTPGNTRRGGGGTSLYIEGLRQFALKRGMASSEEEATRIAFAIAHKHKQQWSPEGFGMPTQNAYSYSKNGARTGWITRMLASSQRYMEVMAEAVFADFRMNLNEAWT